MVISCDHGGHPQPIHWFQKWRSFKLTLLTYLLTPWSTVLLERLTVCPLVKKFSAFYGNPKFITAHTSARHLSLSWFTSIQSIPPHPTSWISILILYSHLLLGLPSDLFPSGFPTNTPYMSLLSTIRTTNPAHFILDFIIYSYIGLYNFMGICFACVKLLKLNWIKLKYFLELNY